ncbi:hypothetical protein ABZ553_05810 [Streptomyces sparsogenes]|uniref:hypothetical protein n=1 Tax=Streptomyces sparsogenes TaxID=67365 RepID=UPI0033CCDE78
MISPPRTTTLWHPAGPKELEPVRALDWRAWPQQSGLCSSHAVGRNEVVREHHR